MASPGCDQGMGRYSLASGAASVRRGSMVDCLVAQFSTGSGGSWEPPSVEVTGIEPVPVASVDPGSSSSGGGNSVLSLESDSSEAAVGSVVACALARPDEPCWKLASCWSRRSTRTGLLPVVVKCADSIKPSIASDAREIAR